MERKRTCSGSHAVKEDDQLLSTPKSSLKYSIQTYFQKMGLNAMLAAATAGVNHMQMRR